MEGRSMQKAQGKEGGREERKEQGKTPPLLDQTTARPDPPGAMGTFRFRGLDPNLLTQFPES